MSSGARRRLVTLLCQHGASVRLAIEAGSVSTSVAHRELQLFYSWIPEQAHLDLGTSGCAGRHRDTWYKPEDLCDFWNF